MEWVVGLLTLTALEIVLGIDNIVFITIVSGKLPEKQQPLARRIGLLMALGSRLLLLFTLHYIVHNLGYKLFDLTSLGIPDFILERLAGLHTPSGGHGPADAASVIEKGSELYQQKFDMANQVSWRDIILGAGGAFLIGKSVYEIHDQFNHSDGDVKPSKFGFAGVLVQIAILDIVFSLDSIITAVGMVDELAVMATAIIFAVVIMLLFAEPVSRFVSQNPTLKMLALSFLILIGVIPLVAESVGAHLDKGYIYFAMVFALIVEFLNLRLRSKGSNK